MGMPRKNPTERSNYNKPVHPETILVRDGVVRGPELPEDIGIEWSIQTRRWWDMVRHSAQAQLMHTSDWEHLIIAATLHNSIYADTIVVDKHGVEHRVPPSPSAKKGCADGFRTYTAAYGFDRPNRSRYGINIVEPEDLEAEAVQAQLTLGGNRRTEVVSYRDKMKQQMEEE